MCASLFLCVCGICAHMHACCVCICMCKLHSTTTTTYNNHLIYHSVMQQAPSHACKNHAIYHIQPPLPHATTTTTCIQPSPTHPPTTTTHNHVHHHHIQPPPPRTNTTTTHNHHQHTQPPLPRTTMCTTTYNHVHHHIQPPPPHNASNNRTTMSGSRVNTLAGSGKRPPAQVTDGQDHMCMYSDCASCYQGSGPHVQVEYCASCSYVARYVIMRCMTAFDTWGSKVTFSLRLGSGSVFVHSLWSKLCHIYSCW